MLSGETFVEEKSSSSGINRGDVAEISGDLDLS